MRWQSEHHPPGSLPQRSEPPQKAKAPGSGHRGLTFGRHPRDVLDIDGVICCSRKGRLEEDKLARLRLVVRRTGSIQQGGARSTDWRKDPALSRLILRAQDLGLRGHRHYAQGPGAAADTAQGDCGLAGRLRGGLGFVWVMQCSRHARRARSLGAGLAWPEPGPRVARGEPPLQLEPRAHAPVQSSRNVQQRATCVFVLPCARSVACARWMDNARPGFEPRACRDTFEPSYFERRAVKPLGQVFATCTVARRGAAAIARARCGRWDSERVCVQLECVGRFFRHSADGALCSAARVRARAETNIRASERCPATRSERNI